MKRNLLLIVLVALFVPFTALAQKSLPYYYGWETSHGAWASAGWTTVSPTGSISYANGNAIHIGSYGCQFYQPATTSVEQKYLITPELDGTEGVLASFWYRNFSANYGSGAFNWGYVTSPDFDPANFDVTLVNWVNENAITPGDFAWHQTENFACPAGTRYVVISCYLTQTTTYQSYAFIDDVSLIKPVSKSISEGYSYGFENNDLATEGWTTQNGYVNNNKVLQTTIAGNNAPRTGNYGFQFYYASTASPQYLISPELTGTDNGVAFSFSYGVYSGSQTFQVGYSNTTNETSAFTFGDAITASNATSATNKNFIELDPQVFPKGTKYVAIKYTSSGYFFVDDISITVPPECEAPTDLQVSDITTSSATISWTGDTDTYGISYQQANANEWITASDSYNGYSYELAGLEPGTTYTVRVVSICTSGESVAVSTTFTTECEAKTYGYTFGFEDSEGGLNCWTKTNANSSTDIASGSARYPVTGSNKGFQFTGSVEGGQYLISPEFEDLVDGVVVSFYQTAFYSSSPQTFQVGYSTTTNQTDAFTFGETITTTTFNGSPNTNTTSNWSLYKIAFPAANIKYVAIKFTGSSYFFVDQFAIASLPSKSFTTEGDWAKGSNWSDGVVPTANDDVVVYAPATINSGTVAYANQITYGSNGSITIKDGGQLKHHTSNLQVVVEKDITAWTVKEGKPDGYYFISKPLSTPIAYDEYLTKVPGMLDNNQYDYYLFNAAGADDLEWRNYRVENGKFGMVALVGYLYANQENVTLKFTGAAYRSANDNSNNFTREYTYEAESTLDWNGWTLVGNPYTANCYLSYNGESYDFYVMNTAGDGYEATSRALKPCEGAFFHYESSGTLTWSPVEPQTSSSPMLEMTVSQGRGTVDNARVRFGNAMPLPKLSFREGGTKLFIPQGGKDYAVVRSEAEGELPINFKAEKNGTYTLSFDMENVAFDNLRLIDNLTGVETDLLAAPSYTFTARTTDYASRFRLVFSANNVNENAENDTFAYFNGSEWVINGSDNATLEVIDMMGRTVLCKDVARNVSTNGWAQGVYVIRLTDNNSVKTQKIVVR